MVLVNIAENIIIVVREYEYIPFIQKRSKMYETTAISYNSACLLYFSQRKFMCDDFHPTILFKEWL